MKCKFCNSQMRLDVKGKNKVNYWKCDNCKASAFEKIRYNKSIFIEYTESEE